MNPIRVLHVTVGLESGGAEMMLYKLVSLTDRSRFEPHVVSLTSEGPLIGARLRSAGVPLTALGFRRGVPNPGLVMNLVRTMRRIQPQVVQTWMYHADLVGGLAGRFVRGVPIVWGLHNSDFDPRLAKRSLLSVIAANRRLSRWLPARIVCCSEAVRTIHSNLGYDIAKLHTIPNGLDTEEFLPSSTAALDLRQELKVDPETELVGYVARWDPQKDHAMFLAAAAQLARVRPNVHFVLCGAGMDESNPHLARLVMNSNLQGRLHLLGLRSDVPYVTAGLTVASCCSSYGESFALVLGEAMACGVPVVSTGLPGPASVIGDEGWIVPIGNASAMVSAWLTALEMTPEEREERGRRARRRIVETFSIQKMVNRYESLYMEVAAGARLDSTTKAGAIPSASR